MKNLYHALGIDPKANHEAVSAALKSNPEMGSCAAILRDEEKRAAYDQAHATLKTIGLLRHRLGLDSGDSWFLDDSPDFAPRLLQEKKHRAAQESAASTTTAEKNQTLTQDQEQLSEPAGSSNQAILIIVGVVVTTLAILAYVFL